MKKRNFLLLLLMSISLCGFAMTDQQVITYIRQQAARGKSQDQIGKELLAKGVTPEQARRIKDKFEAEQMGSAMEEPMDYERSREGIVNKKGVTLENPTGSKASATMGNDENTFFSNSFDGIIYLDQNGNEVPMKTIFGHDIFNSNNPLFSPSVNVGTPQNYRLGPGDEVIIDIWGANEEHFRQVISPEGSIMVEQLGPVYLNGMNITEANNYIKNAFSKKYAGVSEEETDIQLTLGEVRTITVNVMGEVAIPGTFVISPFSTVLNALYLAGGVSNIGTLRNIQVLRNGKKIAGIDVYDYIMNGKTADNITLQEGDVIIVPPYEQLVNITGNVKRPMYYEMLPKETIETLIDYAGGFSGDAYSGMVRLARHAGTENELYNVESSEFNVYHLQDGDIVSVGQVLDRYSNMVQLQGAVMRPGMYALSNDISTVTDLIALADGLKEDAYTGRVLLYREGPELQLQVMAFDLGELLAGKVPDIELKKNDTLMVLSLNDIINQGTLTILGQVAFPGTYPFAENYTLEDLIFTAGGLLDGASTAKVDIARRIMNPEATEQTEQTAEIFTVSIDRTLKYGTGVNFQLMPFDMVHVRKSPGYEEQEVVTIDGEVLFDGNYVLQKRNERVSELVKRAGGVLDEAYIKGAYLERKLTEAEIKAREEVLRIARQNQTSNDSISLDKIEVASTYNVGLDLQKALDNPGTHYDLVLQPGDRLYIPQQQSTVKISGEVMFPNAVLYEPGKKLSHYINQAGGYGLRARKGKTFIVYMNGTVTRAKKNSPIEPGCQIIVPSKPATSGANWAQIMAIASSVTTVAALAATITSIFKR